MKPLRYIVLLSYALILSTTTLAQSAGTTPEKKPDKTIDKCPITLPAAAKSYVNEASGTIDSPSRAASLIKETLSKFPAIMPDLPTGDFTTRKDFYCIIHVLRWSEPSESSSANSISAPSAGATGASGNPAPGANPTPGTGPTPNPPAASGSGSAGSGSKQQVESSNWYVYHGGDRTLRDFNQRGRLFGAKRVYFLLIHLNKQPNLDYRPIYEVYVEEVLPTQVAHLLAAFDLFRTVTSSLPAGRNSPQNIYVADYMDQDTATSKITIKPRIIKLKRVGINCEQATEPEDFCSKCPVVLAAKPEDVSESRVFDNEGRSWWDVSIGIPIKRASQLEFDSTANTITAKKVDKLNILALLNLYYPKVDVKEGNFGWVPHFVGGIAIAKQPLKKYLLGAGWGPRYVQFYVGLLRTEVKEPRTLMEGDNATPGQLNNDLKKVWKNSVGFGINISVKAAANMLKKTTK